MVREEDEQVSPATIVTNYYTGERWFLVSIDGQETYVTEEKFNELKGKQNEDEGDR